MSGEYNTTVTGSTSAELNFTPEVKSFKVRGTHASDLLAKAAHDAMTLERTTAELAAVRAQLEETESERDRLLEVQDNVAVVAEVVTVAEADSVLPEPLVLEDGAEVILVREDDAQVEEVVAREVEAELAAPQTILISTMPPVLPSVTEQAPSASKTEDQPVKTPTEATERKLTRAEIFELSRRNQALVLRTILEHEIAIPMGGLKEKILAGK